MQNQFTFCRTILKQPPQSGYLTVRQCWAFRTYPYRVNIKGKLFLRGTAKMPPLHETGHKIMKILLQKHASPRPFIWRNPKILFTESVGAGFFWERGYTLLTFSPEGKVCNSVKLLLFIQGYFWLKIMMTSFGKAESYISYRIFLSDRRKLPF